MFARLSVATVALALALPMALASPTPSSLEARSGSDPCNSGSLQCCNSVQTAGSQGITSGGLIGAVAPGSLIGLNCSPLSIIGLTSNSCNQQAVCCTNNSFNGVVALGCTPVNINV